MAGQLVRGEVRLHTFAPPDKRRPVVLLTSTAALDYLGKVTIAPITSTIRDTPSQVRLSEADGLKGPCAVNLHNTTTVPKTQLGARVTHLSAQRMAQICHALSYALGCDI